MNIQRRLSVFLVLVGCVFPVSLYAFSLHWPRLFSLTTIITDKTLINNGTIDMVLPIQSTLPQGVKLTLTTITEDDLQGRRIIFYNTPYKVIAKSTGVIDYTFQMTNMGGYGSSCFVEVVKAPIPFVHPYVTIQNGDGGANCQSHYSGGTLYVDIE